VSVLGLNLKVVKSCSFIVARPIYFSDAFAAEHCCTKRNNADVRIISLLYLCFACADDHMPSALWS